jgi:hypothetical protein
MTAPTKNESNAAWMQQMQQMQRGSKRRAQDGDIMIGRADHAYVAPIRGVPSGRKSPRTTKGRISYADVPAVEIPEDRFGYEPPSSAPAISTAAPAPPAIRTGVDAVNFLATIPEVVEDPTAFSHQ